MTGWYSSAGNYHLALTSALIDQGDNSVTVPLDFEGDPRPRGGGIDIGADEAYRAETYVSVFAGNDSSGDGSPGNPFASVTKGLGETRTGGTVYVGRGQYTEHITITRSVNLLGGYHESGWDFSSYDVVVSARIIKSRTGTGVPRASPGRAVPRSPCPGQRAPA